jgi:hypothetical protein
MSSRTGITRTRSWVVPTALSLVVAVLVGACGFGVRPTPAEHFIVPAPPMPQRPPPPKAPVAAIDLFVEKVTNGKYSYRVDFKGRAAGAGNLGVVQGHMNVAGTDFAQTMKFDFRSDHPGLPLLPVSVRGIKDQGWMKQLDAGWKAISGYDVKQTSVPFAAVRSSKDVTFVDTEELDGKTLHRISFPDGLMLHPRTIPGALTKEKVRLTKTTVLIDENGRPVRGRFYLEAVGRVGEGKGQLQEIVFDLTITFSRLNQKMTIKRP